MKTEGEKTDMSNEELNSLEEYNFILEYQMNKKRYEMMKDLNTRNEYEDVYHDGNDYLKRLVLPIGFMEEIPSKLLRRYQRTLGELLHCMELIAVGANTDLGKYDPHGNTLADLDKVSDQISGFYPETYEEIYAAKENKDISTDENDHRESANEKCKYYHSQGEVCYAVKEMPRCHCEGDRNRCDFYSP